MSSTPRNLGIVPTLEQTEWWFTRDGRPLRVAELDVEHIRNVLAYLRRHAVRLRDHRRWYELYVALRAHRARELEASSALDWLNERPLVRALEEALGRATSVDGEVVDVAELEGERYVE